MQKLEDFLAEESRGPVAGLTGANIPKCIGWQANTFFSLDLSNRSSEQAQTAYLQCERLERRLY